MDKLNIYNEKKKMFRALPAFILIFILALYVQQKNVIADVDPPIRILQLLGLTQSKAIESIHYFIIFLIVVWWYMFILYLIELFNSKPVMIISRKGINIRGVFIDWNDVKSIYFYTYYKKEQIGFIVSNEKEFLKQKNIHWRGLNFLSRIFFTNKLPLVSISLTTTKYTKAKFKQIVIEYSGKSHIWGKERKY